MCVCQFFMFLSLHIDVLQVRDLVKEMQYLRSCVADLKSRGAESPESAYEGSQPTSGEESDPENGKLPPSLPPPPVSKFPISKAAVAAFPKDIKMSLFITRLMDYLYTSDYLATHTMTGRPATVGSAAKAAMDPTELAEIIRKLMFFFNASEHSSLTLSYHC